MIGWLLFLCGTTAYPRGKIISLGIMADAQYADCSSSGSRHYRSTLKKIDECVDYFNCNRVDFVVNLGDLVDRSPTDMKQPLSLLKKLNVSLYHVLGNYDYKGGSNTRMLIERLGMPSSYYAFTKGKWTFIFLDTNELSTYVQVADKKNDKEWQRLLAAVKKQNSPQRETWNGGVSKKQWLDNLLNCW